MRKAILFLVAIFAFIGVNAQTSNTKNTIPSPEIGVNYRLYQTNNRWTFLKLDTRDGTITHVQYSTENNAMQYPLSYMPLATGVDAKPGRFCLYPTENTYNFILLDQIDGRVWQVQWNIDEDKRGVWRIY
jgi:hypothetical protein